MTWRVLEMDFGGTDTVHVTLGDGNHRIELMADLELRGDCAVLRGLHVQGAGRNTLGFRALRGLVDWAKDYLDVSKLRIEGALRTSGAGPGRVPAILVF